MLSTLPSFIQLCIGYSATAIKKKEKAPRMERSRVTFTISQYGYAYRIP